jgi:hypothetical protein
MGNGAVAQSLYRGDEKELYDDKTIIERATSAVNGDKFAKLFRRLEDLHQVNLKPTLHFIDIIAFYTQNRKSNCSYLPSF